MTSTSPEKADDDPREAAADLAAAAGDIAGARVLLEGVVGDDPSRLDSWLKLAALRRAGGDISGALRAITSALRVDPLHFVALMSKARLLEAAGREQEADRAYVRALAQGPQGDEPVPASLRSMLDHAQARTDSYRARLEATWNRAIDADPTLSASERGRLRRFKTNALRTTRVFHSEPTHYHYPGLREREFHDEADFAWLAQLEATTDVIRQEFEALHALRTSRAEPYVQYAEDTPVRQWRALNHSLDWTAFHLLRGGERVEENARNCPATMAVLESIPQPYIAGRSPNAMFSLLRPRTRIPPHTGVSNTRLVCHLPLIVPEGCWFRVGSERREWQAGKAFVFDDTIEHEAANDSDEMRIVMIVDVWHPDLGAAERSGITRAMEAEEEQHGAPL